MLKNKKSTVSHHYSSDRPIRTHKKDLLGRSKFAERLAHDIHTWKGEDSLVIALYGEWGSGKSSVKNLVLEANQKKGLKALPTIDFNPWQFSGTNTIPAAFFRELALVLKNEEPKKDIEKREKKLEYYAWTLAVAGTTADTLGKVAPLIGVPGGPLLEGLGKSLKSASSSFQEGSAGLKAQSEIEPKSIEEQKRELSVLLSKLEKPLLVIIDDIDRLTTEEILQIVQLVKANADFPKVVYLLLFERSVVSKSLDKISSGKGEDFLEKIIQVGYHIPQASRQSIQGILFAGLDQYLESKSISKYWDKSLWNKLYLDGIKDYFKNLRHVYRFLASFAFHVKQHGDSQCFEVNPIDLIGLEVLRVFEPSVYERLPTAKTILTRYQEPGFSGEIKQDLVDKTLDQLLSNVRAENKNNVRSILTTLFPTLSSFYESRDSANQDRKTWLRNLRICHPELFEKYFTLSVQQNDLSQAELEKLLTSTSISKDFEIACEALRKRELLQTAFERLEAYKEHIPLANMPTLITALFNMADTFPERQPGFYETDLETYACRLIYFGLKQESNPKKRFKILQKSLTESTGLSLPVYFISMEERVGDREKRGHEFLIENTDVSNLIDIILKKLSVASKEKVFLKNPHLKRILWRWSEWESQEKVKKWFNSQISNTQSALWALTTLMDKSHSWGSDHRVRYFIRLSTLERFLDLPKLIRQLKPANKIKLTKLESIAMKEFRNAIKRRQDGKPDESWESDANPEEEVID